MISIRSKSIPITLYLGILCVLFLLSSGHNADAIGGGAATKPLIFGVFPYLPVTRIEKIYTPFARDLEQALQRPVHLRTRNTFEQFRSDVMAGKFDIIYIQPFDYVRVAAKNNYVPLVRRLTQLKAIIVTKKGSTINSLQQLNGKSISMPPEDAAVSLLGNIELRLVNLTKEKDFHVNYEKNHVACMKKVLTKKSAACVTAPAPFDYFNDKSGNQLVKVFESRKISPSLIAVHKRIGIVNAEKVRHYFLNLELYDAGKQRLESIRMKRFVEADDENYDLVRTIWSELNPE